MEYLSKVNGYRSLAKCFVARSLFSGEVGATCEVHWNEGCLLLYWPQMWHYMHFCCNWHTVMVLCLASIGEVLVHGGDER